MYKALFLFYLTCFVCCPLIAQKQDSSEIFPRMFFSAQMGLSWPTDDFKRVEGAQRGRSFLGEYTLLYQYFGMGCTFIKGSHTTDKAVASKQQLVFQGQLQDVGSWNTKHSCWDQ